MLSGLLRPAVAVFAAIGFIAAAGADTPNYVYYISMRGLQTEAVPSYVTVVEVAAAPRTTAVSACNNLTFYATATDAATIAVARGAGEVVQLHRGTAGQPASSSRIICIIDASGP